MSKRKSKSNVRPSTGVFVSKEELEELVKAKAERDLILNFSAQKGFHSYQLDELLRVLMKLNGISPDGDGDA